MRWIPTLTVCVAAVAPSSSSSDWSDEARAVCRSLESNLVEAAAGAEDQEAPGEVVAKWGDIIGFNCVQERPGELPRANPRSIPYYKLAILVRDSKDPWSKCPKEVGEQANFPFRFSFERHLNALGLLPDTLAEFYRVRGKYLSADARGPNVPIADIPTIAFDFGYFVCLENEWYIHGYH